MKKYLFKSFSVSLLYTFATLYMVIFREAGAGNVLSANIPGYIGLGCAYAFWNKIIFPVGFWFISAIYGVIFYWKSDLDKEDKIRNTIFVGFILHLNLLVITLANEGFRGLSSRIFIIYAHLALVFLTIVCFIISFMCFGYLIRNLHSGGIFYLPLITAIPAQVVLRKSGFVLTLLILFLSFVVFLLLQKHLFLRKHLSAFLYRAKKYVAREGVFLILLFVLGFAVRSIMAYRLGALGLQEILNNAPDARSYYGNAVALLRNLKINNEFSLGYSAFLAVLSRLTYLRIGIVLQTQAFLGALVPVGAYLIGRRIMNSTAARIGAVIAALSQLLIYNAVNLTRESICIILMTAIMLLLLQYTERLDKNRDARAILISLSFLIGAYMVVDPVICFVGVLVGALIWQAMRNLSAVHKITTLISYAGISIFVYLYLTWAIMGEASLTSRNMHLVAIHVSTDFNPYSKKLLGLGINLFRYPFASFSNMAIHTEGLILIVQKVWLDTLHFFFGGNPGIFDLIFITRESFFRSNMIFYAYIATFIGLNKSVKNIYFNNNRWAHLILLAVIAVYALAYIILFVGMTRFRAAIHPLLLLMTGYGIKAIIEYFYPVLSSLRNKNQDQNAEF